MKLNAKEIRDLDEETTIAPRKRYPVYLILDNVYDTYNIGGLYRLSDALAITKLYICGESETPPNIKIKRASIGTYKIVPWEYKKTVVEAIEEIKKNVEEVSDDCFECFGNVPLTNVNGGTQPNEKQFIRPDKNNSTPNEKPNIKQLLPQIISIEQSKKSVLYTQIPYSPPLAFIVGNETFGVSKEALQASDYIAEIPMFGINKSMNVIVSTAIVLSFVYLQQKLT